MKEVINTPIKIKLIRETSIMPRRGTPESAGLDLFADIENPIFIAKDTIVDIPVGVSMQIEPGYVGLIFVRSGMGCKHGVSAPNSVGVIDSDYRGEMHIYLTCLKEEGYTVEPGDRVGQLVVMPVALSTPIEVEELDDSVRGTHGFGSTGK